MDSSRLIAVSSYRLATVGWGEVKSQHPLVREVRRGSTHRAPSRGASPRSKSAPTSRRPRRQSRAYPPLPPFPSRSSSHSHSLFRVSCTNVIDTTCPPRRASQRRQLDRHEVSVETKVMPSSAKARQRMTDETEKRRRRERGSTWEPARAHDRRVVLPKEDGEALQGRPRFGDPCQRLHRSFRRGIL